MELSCSRLSRTQKQKLDRKILYRSNSNNSFVLWREYLKMSPFMLCELGVYISENQNWNFFESLKNFFQTSNFCKITLVFEHWRSNFLIVIPKTVSRGEKVNFERLGVNFTNLLCAAFMLVDPKGVKKTDGLTVFITLLGSTRIKAVCKSLMKLSLELVTLSCDGYLLSYNWRLTDCLNIWQFR